MLVSMTRADLENLIQTAVKAALSNSSIQLPQQAAVSSGKVKKAKKVKDPNAPKKPANDWIKFCQDVRNALLAGLDSKPGFEVQQFCSVLKSQLPLLPANSKGKQEPDYSMIPTAEVIVQRFKAWTPPEQSKAAAERASKAPSSAESPASDSAASAPEVPPVPSVPAEKKARKPQSEETKAAAALKRAATKAANAAASSGTNAAASASSGTNAAASAVPPKPIGPKPAAAAAPAPSPADDENEITDFAPTIIKGKPYIRNKRGDVMTEDYVWIGRYSETKREIDTKFPKPADLDE
jgi:hypothetical protein